MKRALTFAATILTVGTLWASAAHADDSPVPVMTLPTAVPMQRCEYPPEPPMAWPADKPCPVRNTTQYTAPPPAQAPPIDPTAAPVTTAAPVEVHQVTGPARHRTVVTTTTTEPTTEAPAPVEQAPLFVEMPPCADF